MKIQTIASGSKGNCSIILCGDTNIIIDMGVSYLTLKKSLEENSLSFDNFKGILITHCHKDHTKGLSSLIKKTNIPVYIPEKMYDSIKEYVPYPRCIIIDDEFYINDVKIITICMVIKDMIECADINYVKKYLKNTIKILSMWDRRKRKNL